MGDERPDAQHPHEHIQQVLIDRRTELLTKVERLGAHDPAEASNLNFGKRIGDGTTYAVERMTGVVHPMQPAGTAQVNGELAGRCRHAHVHMNAPDALPEPTVDGTLKEPIRPR